MLISSVYSLSLQRAKRRVPPDTVHDSTIRNTQGVRRCPGGGRVHNIPRHPRYISFLLLPGSVCPNQIFGNALSPSSCKNVSAAPQWHPSSNKDVVPILYVDTIILLLITSWIVCRSKIRRRVVARCRGRTGYRRSRVEYPPRACVSGETTMILYDTSKYIDTAIELYHNINIVLFRFSATILDISARDLAESGATDARLGTHTCLNV